MSSVSAPFKISVPRAGFLPDQNRFELDPLGVAEAENWIYRDGIFQVRPGLTTFGNDINQRPSGYIEYDHSDGDLRTVKATTLGWWKYNDSTNVFDDITDAGNPLSGAETDQQAFRVFQKAGATHLLGTNGANSPKKWNGTDATYSAMGGSPPRAKCMMVVADRVLLGNLLSGGTISPVGVDVSALSDFDSGWGTVLTKLLTDTPGDIVSMLEMGNLRGAIYKTDAIYEAIAIGASVPFRYELRKAHIPGPASLLSVVAIDTGIHAYLGSDGGVYQWDGVGLLPIGGRKVKKYLLENGNLSAFGRAFLMFDRSRSELHVVFPEINKTDPNMDLIINLATGGVTWPQRFGALNFSAGGWLVDPRGVTIGELVGDIGDQGGTIGEYAGKKYRLVLGETGGQSYKEYSTDDNGTAISAFWETGLFSMQNGLGWKDIQEIDHLFTKAAAAQAVTVKIGKSDYGEDRTLSTGQVLAIGSAGPYVTGHRISARYLSVRYEVEATQAVKWHGAIGPVAMRGYR